MKNVLLALVVSLSAASQSFAAQADSSEYKAQALTAYSQLKANPKSKIGKQYAAQIKKYQDQCGGRFAAGETEAILSSSTAEASLLSPADDQGNYAWQDTASETYLVLENIGCGFHHGGDVIPVMAVFVKISGSSVRSYVNDNLSTETPVKFKTESAQSIDASKFNRN